jgi:hypothetical protein
VLGVLFESLGELTGFCKNPSGLGLTWGLIGVLPCPLGEPRTFVARDKLVRGTSFDMGDARGSSLAPRRAQWM